MMPDSQRDILGQVMSEGKATLVPLLADMMKTKRVAEIDSSEERQRFWQRALTPDEEAQLWADAMAVQGLSPETMTPEQAVKLGLPISQRVYPDRWDMSGQEGRTTDAQKAVWAIRHARKGPPKDMQESEPAAGAAPPMDEVIGS